MSHMKLETGDVQRLTNYLFKDPTITLLNFEATSIGPAELKMIAEAIRRSSAITSLNVGRNDIGDEGMKILAAALGVNTSLTHLDVANINMGAEGLKILAEVLTRPKSSLASLHVGHEKDVDPDWVKVLKEALLVNTSITSLSLKSTRLGEEEMRMLGEVLQAKSSTITSLHLGNGKFFLKHEPFMLADILRSNTSITTLVLEYTDNIFDDTLEALTAAFLHNTTITSLRLRWYNMKGRELGCLVTSFEGPPPSPLWICGATT